MNVKFLFIFCVLIIGGSFNEEENEMEQLHIEVPFGNPYKQELDEIHLELLEVYDVVRGCIIHFLMDVPLASGAEIEANCVGVNFSIVNHIFLVKTKKAMELYNRSLNERFEKVFSEYPDEIAYFISLYKMFLEKGFHDIYETMQLAKNGSRYHVQEEIYDSLLELSKDMLNIIGSFSSLLLKEKNELKKFIKEKLIERDENLKILLRLDKGGGSEKEAHEAVKSESKGAPMTLAEKISHMAEEIQEETEKIKKGNVLDGDDSDMSGDAGSNKYTAFEESFEPVVDVDGAQKKLQNEFVPEAFDDKHAKDDDEEKEKEKDEEDVYDVKETQQVPRASQPVFKDELDFWYERDNS